MTSDTPIAQMASEAPESLSLAVIVEWWWNNSVVDSKMHGKEKFLRLLLKIRLSDSDLHYIFYYSNFTTGLLKLLVQTGPPQP